MDSITQATLGAAIGEAVLGRKIGYKAVFWGAALGTLPDLDVLVNPFVDNVVEMRLHRGFTHSIFFCLIFSPLLGWAINKFHQIEDTGWIKWSWLVFLVLSTHIAIDTATTYGTQILYPFSDTPFTTDSIFIIDGLYTIPLFLGLILSQFIRRGSGWRTFLNSSGLALSTLYLIWGLGIKVHVQSVFANSFMNQHGYYEMLKTTPNGPNSFLWTGYAAKNDTIYNAVYSIFDSTQNLDFTAIPRRTNLIEEHIDDRAVETLLWFSRGYYSVEKRNSGIVFSDLRFGRDDLWLKSNGEFVWKNYLIFDEDGRAQSFEQALPSFDTRSQIYSLYWDRIWGK